MSSQLKKNLSNTNYWIRALYVLLFAFAAEIVAILAVILAVVQVIFSLVAGESNQRITQFGDSIAKYLCQCYLFITFKSEEKPFPFADWPEGQPNESPVVVEPTSEKTTEEIIEPEIPPENEPVTSDDGLIEATVEPVQKSEGQLAAEQEQKKKTKAADEGIVEQDPPEVVSNMTEILDGSTENTAEKKASRSTRKKSKTDSELPEI